MKSLYQVGDIVVIGGDANSQVVQWVEYNYTYGLYTGFEVIDVVDSKRVRIAGYSGIVHDDNIISRFDLVENFFDYTRMALAQSACDLDNMKLRLEDVFVSRQSMPNRFELITIVGDKSFYEASNIDEAYEFLMEHHNKDYKIFLDNTNLIFRELKNMKYNDNVTATIIKDSGEHMLFTGLAPYQALWLDERIEDDEYINLFNEADAISKKDFLLFRTSERNKKGIELFGEDMWMIIAEYLSIYEYDVIFRDKEKLTLLDLQCADDDMDLSFTEFISKILKVWSHRAETEEDEDLTHYFKMTSSTLREYLFSSYKTIKTNEELLACDIEEKIVFDNSICKVEEIHKTLSGSIIVLRDMDGASMTVCIPR